MWDKWYTMNIVMYGIIFQNIMCAKLGLYFANDVDTEFGSGVGGGFEVGFEYEVGSKNVRSVNNYIKDKVYYEISDSAG